MGHSRHPSNDQNITASPNGWIPRHRAINSMSAIGSNGLASLTNASQSTASNESSIMAPRPANIRHSLEMKPIEQKFVDPASDAPTPTNNNGVLATPPKLQASFSANDVPTLKNVSGSGLGSTSNQAAQQHLHNHNASMGRIPAGALPNRHSRELSADNRDNIAAANYQSIGSTLQASAPPFGPVLNQGPALTQAPQAPQTPAATTMANPQAMTPYNNGYYVPNGYANMSPANGAHNYHGVPPLLSQMQGLSINGANTYSAQNYTGYAPVYAPPQPRDSQARIMQSRRQQDNEGKYAPIFTRLNLS